MSGELTIVTGPSGSGKSAWCAQRIEQARLGGLEVGGLLSKPVFDEGQKVAIDLLDIQSGERRRLANPPREGAEGPATECWQFDAQTLTWANQVLRELVGCEVVIIDELGPLEFLRGEGLLEGLSIVDAQRFPKLYVIIRPELLAHAKGRWPWAVVLDVSVNGLVQNLDREKDG